MFVILIETLQADRIRYERFVAIAHVGRCTSRSRSSPFSSTSSLGALASHRRQGQVFRRIVCKLRDDAASRVPTTRAGCSARANGCSLLAKLDYIGPDGFAACTTRQYEHSKRYASSVFVPAVSYSWHLGISVQMSSLIECTVAARRTCVDITFVHYAPNTYRSIQNSSSSLSLQLPVAPAGQSDRIDIIDTYVLDFLKTIAYGLGGIRAALYAIGNEVG